MNEYKKFEAIRAFVVSAPGKTRFEQKQMPEISTDTDVLVKVRAVGICGSDMKILHGMNTVATYPRVIGHEVAGEVVDTGPGVTTLAPGDHVVLEPIEYCGSCYACLHDRGNVCQNLRIRGINVDGGCQEYITADESKLNRVSPDLKWTQAVMTEPYTLGQQMLARARVRHEDVVAVFGMGPIGLIMVSTLKRFGVRQIIATDVIESRLHLARQLGAGHIINAGQEDVPARLAKITGGMGPNVVVEASGIPQNFAMALETASVAGTVVPMAFSGAPVTITTSPIGKKELNVAGSRLAAGKFPDMAKTLPLYREDIDAIVTHVFPFEQAAQAFEMAGSRASDVIKVVIVMEG